MKGTPAEQTKDFDKVFAALTRDAKGSYQILKVVQACKDFGKIDLAIEWAEKGLLAPYQGGVDPRVKSALACLYAEKGRIDEAFRLLWDNLENCRPYYVEAYDDLKIVGAKVGFRNEWRDLALTHFRESKGYDRPGCLVRIFIHEGLLKTAYDEAKAHGCSQEIWEELARALERTEPELAYRTYGELFAFAMTEYESLGGRYKITGAIGKMRELAIRVEKSEIFLAWVEQQKREFKDLRGFLNDLKKMKL